MTAIDVLACLVFVVGAVALGLGIFGWRDR